MNRKGVGKTHAAQEKLLSGRGARFTALLPSTRP